MKVFIDNTVELVIGFEDSFEYGVSVGDDKEKTCCKEGDDAKENSADLCVYAQSHNKRENEHSR